MYWSSDASTFLFTKYFICTLCLINSHAYIFVTCMIIILLTLWQLHYNLADTDSYANAPLQLTRLHCFVLTDFPEVGESSPLSSPVTDQEALPPSPLPSEASEDSQEDSLVCVGVEEPKSDPEIAKRYSTEFGIGWKVDYITCIIVWCYLLMEIFHLFW